MEKSTANSWLVFVVLLAAIAVCTGKSSASSDEDDEPRNYTCSVGDACAVDSDQPFAYLEGFRYCCYDDHIISFTVNFDTNVEESDNTNFNITVAEKVQQGFNCTCLDLGEKNLKERISEAFDDIKDKVKDRWDDAKDWLDDIF
ncbi:hypothetical protein PoB_005542600 [Plakobranchus ocellatus]|uniref:Uncharacterized protein n=1 Tax=Plakobranchus ocellatus TaxID=259542 RepID=A0AAV4CC25_9GAST|nr:hypothetical protein PoB_005542600 [Plakobranchus ocellatus]